MENIKTGLQFFRCERDIQILAESGVYESPSMYAEGPAFLNVAIKIRTSLDAVDLLDCCQRVEIASGRAKIRRKNTPRTLDVDIIYLDRVRMDSEKLTIPHPKRLERAFVILPILEIEPNFIDSQTGEFLRNINFNEQKCVMLETVQ
ncbi:MAG: 2-amino-4-hydroxy-6-hydroxymethyldihydropteridine diphosphokinase [Candidatus Marinimicrobia bacterium]|nr:2-amino-4-hydroxy-6-hydroxymethyldihydropteridine diphosphokinase [Candidatus Neomarinimicrobiota bacterium]